MVNKPKITIYTTDTCGYCKMAKSYFQAHDIDYMEKNVTRDTDAQREMMEKSHQMGVPVIDINGEIVIGFNKPMIDHLIS